MNLILRKPTRSPSRRCCALALAIVAAGGAAPPAALAQRETPENVAGEESQDPPEIETFALRHADAEIVINVLQTLLADEPGARLAIGANNRLIVHAAPRALKKVRETLEAIDQPPEDRNVIKVFGLRNTEASQAAGVLTQLVQDVEVAFDVRTNSLIVSSPSQANLDKVEALALMLDQGAPEKRVQGSCHIELFWLTEADDQDDIAEVDSRIAQAAGELQRHGFARIKQEGYVRVIVSPGGEFRVLSSESLGDLEMQGKLGESDDGQLELKLELAVRDKEVQVVSVMTEFNTRPDHDVVIGVASSRNQDRRNAFVIRVEK